MNAEEVYFLIFFVLVLKEQYVSLWFKIELWKNNAYVVSMYSVAESLKLVGMLTS